MKENLITPPELEGIDLDEFLSLRFPRIAKGRLRRLIREGRVIVDGVVQVNSRPLDREVCVRVDLPEKGLPEIPLSRRKLQILYEDDSVMCIDKSAGLSVEPERWKRKEESLMGVVLNHIKRNGSGVLVDYRPRMVHRIDKGTSGVLLLAKTLEAERELRRQFGERKVEKVYLVIVEGEVPGEGGEVDLPIGPDPRRSGKMRIDRGKGDEAQTVYEVAERFRGFTLVFAYPKTGRTHQIRVHLATRGFPLAVDDLYGGRSEFFLSEIKPKYRFKRGRKEIPLLARLSLHAYRLKFQSPSSGKVQVEAKMPPDFDLLLKKLRRYRSFYDC